MPNQDDGPYQNRPHLNGEDPMLDVQAYMDDTTDDVAFVIVRTYQCTNNNVMLLKSGATLSFTEAIYIKSAASKSAIDEIATCHFRSHIPPPPPMPGAKNDLFAFEMNQISPAELFFFHHHKLMKTWIVDNPDSRAHIERLLQYIAGKYGSKFDEAESLLDKGVINQSHITKLFRPNEPIVAQVSGKSAAFMLQDWPVQQPYGGVKLVGWSYQADGSGFDRKQSAYLIPPLEKETDIKDLTVYPLRFGSPDLRTELHERGKKQWQYRNMAQITYKGRNVGGDLYFVSLRP